MASIKKIALSIQYGAGKFFNGLKNNPLESIELIIAIVTLAFAIYTGLPEEIRGISSAYDHNAVRIIFASIMAYPAVSLITLRVTKSIHDYIYTYPVKRRLSLFMLSMTWIFISLLRIVVVSFLPPIWIAYLAFAIISYVCYLRLGS